jgi:hypothetical protein
MMAKKISGVLVIKDGKARVWNRPRGFRRKLVWEIIERLPKRYPSALAFPLFPTYPLDETELLSEILRRHDIRYYDIVKDVFGDTETKAV